MIALTVMISDLTLNRSLFRPNLQLLCVVLCVGFVLRALHSRRRRDFILGGIFAGLNLYTYTSAWAFPLGFIGFKWSADEEREALAFYDALPEPAPGAQRAAWRCYAALLVPARREAPEVMQARVATWLQAGLPEILADAKGALPLHNHFLVVQLRQVQSYLAHFQLPLEAMSAAILSVEAMLGAHFAIIPSLRVGAGIGTAVTKAYGASDLRVLWRAPATRPRCPRRGPVRFP